MLLQFTVRGQQIFRVDKTPLASDSRLYIAGAVDFDGEWDDITARWLTFEPRTGTAITAVLADGSSFDESLGVSLSAGTWRVSAHGTNTAGKEIHTTPVLLNVAQAGGRDGEAPPYVPPDAAGQIAAVAEEARDIAQSVRDDADAGLFKGDKGDKGDAFEYSDFTPEQLAALKGAPGAAGQSAYAAAQAGGYTDTEANFYADLAAMQGLSGGQVQSDYAQNDPTAKDYVKNRPFYTGDPVETVLVEESTVDFVNDGVYKALWPDSSANFEAVEGQTYKVYFDGVPYSCVAKLINSLLFIGNARFFGKGEDTGEPFIIFTNGSQWVIVTTDTSPSHVLSISGLVNEIKQIDSKYLPIASDDEYGVVKRSEIITSYVFPNATVGVSQMKKAIDDFNNGSARIKWEGDIVISARYEDDGTLYIVFSSQPYRTMSMTSDTTYRKNLLTQVSSDEGYMGRLRISSTDSQNVESVIDCYGSSASDRTISIGAEHFDLVSADLRMLNKVILNRKELILQSSTDSSTKRFKITVDDSGNISAIEITE